jgi:UDP-glucose 4-epimerase
MRTFLTGASGYIGLHLLRELLQAGHSVTVAVRAKERLGALAHPNVTVIEADLESDVDFASWVAGHDCCVHCAFIWGRPRSEFEVKDASVTAKLFDGCGVAGVKRCIHLSSVAVHRPFAGRMHEEDRICTNDYYGATKAASEMFMRAACATHGMEGVVIRPGLVVGPPAFHGASFRTDGRIARMVDEAMSCTPVVVPAEPARQFTDVSALVRIIRNLTVLDSPRPTYICVDREVIAWETVAEIILRASASTSQVRKSEKPVGRETPIFVTSRVEELEGRTLDARQALAEHIRCMVDARR